MELLILHPKKDMVQQNIKFYLTSFFFFFFPFFHNTTIIFLIKICSNSQFLKNCDEQLCYYEVCFLSQWEPYYILTKNSPLYDERLFSLFTLRKKNCKMIY